MPVTQHSEGSAPTSPESAEEFASQLSRGLHHACIAEAQQRQKPFQENKNSNDLLPEGFFLFLT